MLPRSRCISGQDLNLKHHVVWQEPLPLSTFFTAEMEGTSVIKPLNLTKKDIRGELRRKFFSFRMPPRREDARALLAFQAEPLCDHRYFRSGLERHPRRLWLTAMCFEFPLMS